MTTDADGGHRPVGPTFAQVINGFSFGSGRAARRRRPGRHRMMKQPGDRDRREVRLEDPPAPAEPSPPDSNSTEPELAQDRVGGAGSAAVRPYAWTSGRTRSGYHLEIGTLVSIGERGREQLSQLRFEHRMVAELCEETCSVAEIAALLAVPLGVAKVLLGDMAELGLITVHEPVDGDGDVPDLALMERVLSGLRRL